MVAKRKESPTTMALMKDDINPEDHSTPGERVDTAPRRSGRKIKQTGVAMRHTADDAETEKLPSKRARTKGKNETAETREGVKVAIDGLREMEETLRESVKRQKLALIRSTVLNDAAETIPEQAAFLPRPTTSSAKTLLTKSSESDPEKLPKPHRLDMPQIFPEDDAPEMPDAEGDDAKTQDFYSAKQKGARPPPVNSGILPLPWKGRLGYACLNTYLRLSNPPVFSSRTCRIASILEHRHPLRDQSQPEHPIKNRPDKEKPADITRGQKYVENLGLTNARDIVKMLRWNDKYHIKFMRLSSEMFPFASHEQYGYKLAPFASEVLAEAGRVAGELGHRLTMHPGQFTQLGSPRKEVVRNSVRDLEYHNELLMLLRLPEQANKDAVMIIHMGGMFGDKAATLARFKENYSKLSAEIKARLVLENDDVSWSVHDLLPICEELNIPLVLDFHHHNIVFDKEKVREGTKDIMELFPRIKATWDRKGITQKMHYSEPCSEAITPRQRRKHSPRVMALPPCANDMDLMIEAKDKEQAVFSLMRNYRLPGWDSFNDITPYERDDENKAPPKPTPPKKKRKSKKADADDDEDSDTTEVQVKPPPVIPSDEVGMGGPDRRVYWPLGMEEWLQAKKKEKKRKNKDADSNEDINDSNWVYDDGEASTAADLWHKGNATQPNGMSGH